MVPSLNRLSLLICGLLLSFLGQAQLPENFFDTPYLSGFGICFFVYINRFELTFLFKKALQKRFSLCPVFPVDAVLDRRRGNGSLNQPCLFQGFQVLRNR